MKRKRIRSAIAAPAVALPAFAIPALVAAILLPAGAALASTDAAWQQFATDVARSCKAAAGGRIAAPRIVVDPTGSEHFGLAILTGRAKAGGGKAGVTLLCVYDKQKKKAEIGSELGPDAVRVTVPSGSARP